MLPDDTQERTFAEVIAQSLVRAAATGNILAAKEIADRTEGKPKQAVDMTMNVNDWRELARQHGVSEHDVINEARRLIEESVTPGSGASGH
jgi:predicted transcriptional regulator